MGGCNHRKIYKGAKLFFSNQFHCQPFPFYQILLADYAKRWKDKNKKVDNAIFYEYLNEGDRVRFLPRLNGYYEKYDKSHDTYLICPACLKKNVSVNDRCAHCGIILLK